MVIAAATSRLSSSVCAWSGIRDTENIGLVEDLLHLLPQRAGIECHQRHRTVPDGAAQHGPKPQQEHRRNKRPYQDTWIVTPQGDVFPINRPDRADKEKHG